MILTRWNYDRKFKMFRASITDKDWFEEKEESIYKSVENKSLRLPDWMKGTASRQYRLQKQRIFDKWKVVFDTFKKYAKVAPNENEAVTWYHTMCLQDVELHALNYVKPDNGLPMFLYPWQSEFAKNMDEFNVGFSLDSRKIGKTELSHVIASMWATNNQEHVRIFAPTEKQLFVLEDILSGMEQNDFLYEEFIIGPHDVRRKQGSITKEHAVFGRNGSTIRGSNLSQTATKGKSKVGEKGSKFIADEWGLILKDVFNTVILPMLADTSSRKKLIGFGTATLDVNPDMEDTWKEFVRDNDIYTVMIPWTKGVMQGCISRWYMKMAFKRNHIPCPFGRAFGICAKEWIGPHVRFDENTLDADGEWDGTVPPLKYPGDKGYENAWRCDDSCYLSKSFSEEHWAMFVSSERRYWPMSMVESAADPALDWWYRVPPGTKPELYASVDFGLRLTHTQALVGEKIGNKMFIRAWKEIAPLSEKKEKIHPGSGAALFRELHGFFEPFIPHIHKYFFDITGDKMGWMSEFLVKGIDDVPGYPRSRIYQTESTRKKGLYGIEVGGSYNAILKENLKIQLSSGSLRYPLRQPFFDNLKWEFQHCHVEKTSPGYLSFKEPKSGRRSIDLIDALSFLVIPLDPNFKKGGNYYEAIGFKHVPSNRNGWSDYNAYY